MSARLLDRVVLVTGASAGIGRALACQLVARGCRVVATARSRDRLLSLAEELGDAVLAVPADVCDDDDVRRLADTTAAELGRIDVVVNNAAIGDLEPFLLTQRDRWQQVVDTNLFGGLRVAQAFLPAMLVAGRGLIANIGSTGASGWPYVTLYAASKAALRAASVSLDLEYAQRGVRVLWIEMHSTVGTNFGAGFDPQHLTVAAEAWKAHGIDFDRGIRTAEESAARVVSAIESAWVDTGRPDGS